LRARSPNAALDLAALTGPGTFTWWTKRSSSSPGSSTCPGPTVLSRRCAAGTAARR